MFFRLILAMPLLVAAPAVAQGLDAFRLDLSAAALAGDETMSAGALAVDGGLSFGSYGVQLSAAAQRLDGSPDLAMTSLRLMLHRAVGDHLRIGLSAGMATGDDPAADALSLGLHARYDAPGWRIGGSLIKPPDDQATNGVFVMTAQAEQDLRPDLTLRGELYRRSSDSETVDIAAALIGLERDFSSNLSGFGNVFLTNADDHAYYNQGGQIGAVWHWAEGRDLYGAITHKTGTGIDTIGLTLGLRINLGAGDTLFETSPLPDLVGHGTY